MNLKFKRSFNSLLNKTIEFSTVGIPILVSMLVGALILALFWSEGPLKELGNWMSKDSRGICIIGVASICGLLIALYQEARRYQEQHVIKPKNKSFGI